MQGAYRALLLVHVVLGSTALVAFWAALLARKGSPAHRRRGRIFVRTLAATALTALPLCLAVQVFDPIVIRPPEPGLSVQELAEYPEFIRGLFQMLAGIAVFALACLVLAMRALTRGRIAEHVTWILSAGVVGHSAFFISILPRIFPGIYERDPTQNPLPWLLPPLVGAVVVTWARTWAAYRYGAA